MTVVANALVNVTVNLVLNAFVDVNVDTLVQARVALERERRVVLATHLLRAGLYKAHRFEDEAERECAFCACDLYLSFATTLAREPYSALPAVYRGNKGQDNGNSSESVEARLVELEEECEGPRQVPGSRVLTSTACLECAPLLLPMGKRHARPVSIHVYFRRTLCELDSLVRGLSP